MIYIRVNEGIKKVDLNAALLEKDVAETAKFIK